MNNGKKFDICLMNPPYSRGVSNKFLDKTLNISKIVISVQPSSWIQNEDSRDYKKYINIINKTFDFEYISTFDAKKIFNIQTPDIGIFVCNETGGFDFDKIFNNELIKKIKTYIKNNTAPIELNKKQGWRVRIPASVPYGGGGGKRKTRLNNVGKMLYFYNGERNNKKWYEFYQKNQNSKTTETITQSILFKTESQANNFCNTFNLPLVKYIEHKLIVDMRLNEARLLWLGNAKNPRTNKIGYKSEWINEDLEKFFELNYDDIKKYKEFIKQFN